MIEITHVSKNFDDIKAVDDISLTLKENSIIGLIGTNGAGKSTLLRMVSGVYAADSGEILIDGLPVYDNPKAKELFFYISDDPYYPANGTPIDMQRYYSGVYPAFDSDNFYELLAQFGLDKKRRIKTFSKGMKKQLSVITAVCSGTKYIFCDETFDGLDPVMRQAVKAIFAREMDRRGLTPIIASHNLREIEDICDYVGLLHKGGVLLSKDIEEMKTNLHKVQCAFAPETDVNSVLSVLDLLKIENRGSLYTLTIRGHYDDTRAVLEAANPLFLEMLPLSLEEIFISETEVAGYDIKSLIL